MTARPLTRRVTGGIAAGVMAVVLAGCGDPDPTPADSVPELTDTLEQVDTALVDRRFGQARQHLNSLIDTTSQAHEAGELSAAEADQILAAAETLLNRLPESQPGSLETTPSPTPTPTPTPTPSPTPQQPSEEEPDEGEGDDKEAEKEQRELEKKLQEEQKKLEEELKKEEQGGGNGESGGNGPDDGEGN